MKNIDISRHFTFKDSRLFRFLPKLLCGKSTDLRDTMTRLRGIKILIVDDEEYLREIFREKLSEEEAVVYETENGESAFKLLQKTPMDVVISDVRMPKGDGITLISNIQKHIQVKPIVFLCTGYSDITPEKAKRMGTSGILSKPFDLEILVSNIESAIKDSKKTAA